MGKVLAALVAGAISFVAFFQVGSFLRGDDGGGIGANYSRHMEGCMRQMRQIIPTEEAGLQACECIYSEFEKKGYSMTDAFGNDFHEMSRITRGCAADAGAVLP